MRSNSRLLCVWGCDQMLQGEIFKKVHFFAVFFIKCGVWPILSCPKQRDRQIFNMIKHQP